MLTKTNIKNILTNPLFYLSISVLTGCSKKNYLVRENGHDRGLSSEDALTVAFNISSQHTKRLLRIETTEEINKLLMQLTQQLNNDVIDVNNCRELAKRINSKIFQQNEFNKLNSQSITNMLNFYLDLHLCNGLRDLYNNQIYFELFFNFFSHIINKKNIAYYTLSDIAQFLQAFGKIQCKVRGVTDFSSYYELIYSDKNIMDRVIQLVIDASKSPSPEDRMETIKDAQQWLPSIISAYTKASTYFIENQNNTAYDRVGGLLNFVQHKCRILLSAKSK